jgi:hypothetical protein
MPIITAVGLRLQRTESLGLFASASAPARVVERRAGIEIASPPNG